MTLHQQLKAVTTDLHRQLDSQSVLSEYMSPTLDADRLEALLKTLWLAYRKWQAQLSTFADLHPVPSFALCDLNLQPLANRFTVAPSENVPPLRLASVEDYLGCAYVFNGAALGNRYILQKLKKNPHIHPEQLAYFETVAQKAISKPEWLDWVARVEEHCHRHHLDEEAVCLAARDCFTCLLLWFSYSATNEESQSVTKSRVKSG